MKFKCVNFITLLFLLTALVYSQDVVNKDDKEKNNELKEKAVVLLRETVGEIDTLRTIENRISFRSETASLMWYYNADEGKRMFSEVTNNFVQLLGRYNAEINSYGGIKGEEEFYTSMISGTERNKAIRRMGKAVAVRQQIALSMSRHDAELGYNFINETAQIVTDPNYRKMIDKQDEALESRIIALMSVQDVDKALKIGRRALSKKFNSSLLNLLAKIHKKDKEKGAEFAKEIMDKVRSEMSGADANVIDAYTVLKFGLKNLDETKGIADKTPIFSENSLKELADSSSNALLRKTNLEETYYLDSFYDSVNKLSPVSARRLKAKFKDSITGSNKSDTAGRVKIREAIVDGIAIKGSDNSTMLDDEAEIKAQAEKTDLMEALRDPKNSKISDENKEKFVGDAKRVIEKMDEPIEKITALSGLALSIKQLGDEKLASELMSEASLLINSQPVNFMEYMQTWMLASGYSSIDAEKAFPILEDAIFRLNDTISAFVKVGQFIDVSGEMVIDDEVQLGSFGGGMTQGLLGSIKVADSTISNLATANFAKTKSLADRFNRPEVRILAKMMILKSILGDDAEESEVYTEKIVEDSDF